MKVHRFRLYPSKETEEKMFHVMNLCRQTYNILLEQYSKFGFTKFENQSIIPSLKICMPELSNVHSKTLQYENYKLYSNLKALHEIKKKGKKVGRLRYKGEHWFKSFTYNQSGFSLKSTGKRFNILYLSKIGDIPIRCHNRIKNKIKGIVIKRESSGKWYASVQEETQVIPTKKLLDKVVGIDLGSTDIVYDSDNNHIVNPGIIKIYADRIAKANRRLSKKKKGGINRLKAIRQIAVLYEKMSNCRNDFCHKISRDYVNNYDVIGFEDMDISNLLKGNKLAKNMLDGSLGKIRQYTSYKAESAGKLCIFVETKGTTYECSRCGNKVPKELWERRHQCLKCGFDVPRDYNSALEIKYRTIKRCLDIGQELSESTLVEMRSIPKWANFVNETRRSFQNLKVLV